LHKQIKELSEREGISLNQFITTAVAEKLSALMTVEYLRERAARGDRARFDAVLAKVPAVPPPPADRIESPESEPRRRRRG
jgi:hypothetical protein